VHLTFAKYASILQPMNYTHIGLLTIAALTFAWGIVLGLLTQHAQELIIFIEILKNSPLLFLLVILVLMVGGSIYFGAASKLARTRKTKSYWHYLSISLALALVPAIPFFLSGFMDLSPIATFLAEICLNLVDAIAEIGVWGQILIVWLIAMMLFFVPLVLPRQNDYRCTRRPHGTQDKDQYEVTKAAKRLVEVISDLTDPVNVITLNGGVGSGKSFMVGKIIDQIDYDKTLITYLSLTETNTEDDFSKLFRERWHETLSARYLMLPQKLSLSGTANLRAILRENGGGLMAQLAGLLEMFGADKPLHQTKAKVCETTSGAKNKTIDSQTAKLFYYLPELTEDTWLIVIDELERAPYKEILRVIEVIERFKQAAVGGLPIKLVFLLPIDEKTLIERLETPDQQHDSDLIRNFLISDPKNITHQTWMPPKDYEKTATHFQNCVNALQEEFGLETPPPDTENSIRYTYTIISRLDGATFQEPYHEAMNFIESILQTETPRVINRTVENCKFFLSAYKRLGEEEQIPLPPPRLPDLLIFSYAMVRHGWLITFIGETLDLISYRRWYILTTDLNLQYRDEDRPLVTWIEEKTGKKIENWPRRRTTDKEIPTTSRTQIPAWLLLLRCQLLSTVLGKKSRK
jgi:hypothetical protein